VRGHTRLAAALRADQLGGGGFAYAVILLWIMTSIVGALRLAQFSLDPRVAPCDKKCASHAAISIDVMVGEKPFKGAVIDASGVEADNNSKPFSAGTLGGFIFCIDRVGCVMRPMIGKNTHKERPRLFSLPQNIGDDPTYRGLTFNPTPSCRRIVLGFAISPIVIDC
jgi:hypothetical protein